MPTKSTQKVKQEIIVVIDKSGSMSGERDDVIGGFNTYISDLKAEEETDINLTMVMFDNYVHKLYSGQNIQKVAKLDYSSYSPNGGTALNDALMEAIEDCETRLKKSKAKNKPQVMVVVFTDGEENSSQKFRDKDEIKKRRADKEAEGWAFIFMGADMDAWAAGSSYGMSAGNTMSLGKQAIGASASYLSNRTAKAARLYASNSIGEMDNLAYAQSMSNIMTLDADDLANDAQAVALKATIDSSVNSAPPTQAPFTSGLITQNQIDKLLNTKSIWTSPIVPNITPIKKGGSPKSKRKNNVPSS